MEYKKEEKRVLAHSGTKEGRQDIVKINSLSYGLTLSEFRSGFPATGCEVFINHFPSLDLSFSHKIEQFYLFKPCLYRCEDSMNYYL